MRASIEEGAQDMTVTSEEQANFSCSVVGSEVNIQWTVDGNEYESCSQGKDTDIDLL